MQKRDPTCAACAFLLLLHLTPVSPQCRKGTPDECWKAEIVPGGYLPGKGFDITRLSNGARSWVDSFKRPGVGCTLCVNPLLKGNPLQRLPLYITDWKAKNSCQHKVHHSVHQLPISVAEALTELQVKNDWTNELDLMVNPTPITQWALAESRSEWTKDCIRKSSEDKYIFLLHHVTCSYYKVRISKEDQFISEHVKDEIKLLPEKYDSTSNEEYFRLIGLYGTHIATEVDLGAHVRYLTAVPVCKAVLENISVSVLSRCLAIFIGLRFGFDGVTNSSDFQMCEEKEKKNPNFFHLLEVMHRVMRGGNLTVLNPYEEWLDSAKSLPAVLLYSLEPIHNLLAKGNPRREGLRQAVSEYVKKRALWRNCSQPCPPGSQPSANDSCSCECPNNNFTNSMCLTMLTVTIDRAEGLWGDYITRSDGYGRVVFQNTEKCTHIVWNNNNPIWDVTFDFGVFKYYNYFNELIVEVWDADFGWNDDLLGSCQLTVLLGYESRTCFLKNGLLHFKYEVVCVPNMGGRSGSDYSSP